MKIREILSRAFSEVVSSKYQISNIDYDDGLRYLNRMMAKMAATGIDVGYTQASSIDDDLTVQDGAILGMVKNLAVNLWPQYNSEPVNNLLSFSAKRSMEAMRNIGFDTIDVALFPSTLPIGSGDYRGAYSENFYTNETDVSIFIGKENGEQH